MYVAINMFISILQKHSIAISEMMSVAPGTDQSFEGDLCEKDSHILRHSPTYQKLLFEFCNRESCFDNSFGSRLELESLKPKMFPL